MPRSFQQSIFLLAPRIRLIDDKEPISMRQERGDGEAKNVCARVYVYINRLVQE